MLTLYYAPKTCSLAPMIALEEAGAEYTAHKVDFAKNEQNTAPFKYVNPKGRVPALATDKGVITENVAILSCRLLIHISPLPFIRTTRIIAVGLGGLMMQLWLKR
jgi:glutathione S-transferase